MVLRNLVNRLRERKKEITRKLLREYKYYFKWKLLIVDPPNHISNSPEAYDLDSCDLICYLLPNIEQFTSTDVSCLELIVSVHGHLTSHFFDNCWYAKGMSCRKT